MNKREIGELRRRMRRDRSNMTAVYGCYVNENKQIIARFRRSTGMMPENEAEKYFALFRRALSGTIGRNLIDIAFKTAQVAGGEEHRMLMRLRETALEDEALREQFCQKVIDSLSLSSNYLILLGCDTYDVPFKSKSGESTEDSRESFTYIVCAVCPVRETKGGLRYLAQEKTFCDGAAEQIVAPPEVGFLFPAFDDRATNLYNALYYTHSPKDSHEAFADAVFHAPIPKPAAEQKRSFEALLSDTLDEECSMEVVQSVQEALCRQIELHKQSRQPEPLLVEKQQVRRVLEDCGVSEERVAKFSVDYDAAFGFEAALHPKNIIDEKHLSVRMPDVSVTVDPSRSDLIEMRTIGGVQYLLISAQEDVEVNGVRIHAREEAEPRIRRIEAAAK